MKRRTQRPEGRQVEGSTRDTEGPLSPAGLALPHERDEAPDPSANATPNEAVPDPAMLQAHRDLAAGQVDTDMRATPGLDAARRDALVPGPGGQSPGRRRL